jgi:ribosomal protein L7/L12
MNDQRTALETARERFVIDGDLEAVLRFLRENGCSIIESIKATMELTGAPLAAAKETVHGSDAWRDRRGAHDEFHRTLAEDVEADVMAGTRRA